jgi:hypothetical protein
MSIDGDTTAIEPPSIVAMCQDLSEPLADDLPEYAFHAQVIDERPSLKLLRRILPARIPEDDTKRRLCWNNFDQLETSSMEQFVKLRLRSLQSTVRH